MDSIMPTERDTCDICGCYLTKRNRNEHHIFFGTANRRISEAEGMKVFLCVECHTIGKHSVHKYRQADLNLKRDAQQVWEDNYMKSYPYENHADMAAREAFIALFGRSYL